MTASYKTDMKVNHSQMREQIHNIHLSVAKIVYHNPVIP